MSGCLSDLDVLAILEGTVAATTREGMLQHSDDCDSCRALLVAIGKSVEGSGGATDDGPVARGATVGRYVVMELLGVGGTGEVHSAFDPVLERKVALKLLRDDDAAHERLVREGKTMARLSHPNIVPVFDVGTFGTRLYVAMEYVDGRTLRAWLDEQRRTWREIVVAFAHAGRGLEAAHAEGIIHRDFKPENVLVGRDGRVRVLDFGLAFDLAATANDGTLAGTPAYMAPELFERTNTPSPIGDQYAFCVALYEALHGVRPFAGDTAAAIVDHARRGELTPPKHDAPAWIHRVAIRGLAAKPEDRFASMTELLAALDRDPARAVRAMAIGGVMIALLGVSMVALATRSSPAVDACAGGPAAFASAWSPERATAIRTAFTAAHKPYADETSNLVAKRLDTYATDWRAMYGEACRATKVRGDQSADLLDLRMECLHEQQQRVTALVDLFARADADVVQRAARSVETLPVIAACADGPALRATIASPAAPAARAELDRIRAELAAAVALRTAGKFADGLARARTALVAARAVAYAPIVAEAAYIVGLLEADTGDPKTAVVTLAEAARAAADGHADRIATQALIDLARINADKLNHLDTAAALVEPATWAIARFGSDAVIEARMLDVQAFVLEGQGKHAEATPIYERALALRRRTFGASSPEAARSLLALGENHRLRHEYPEADELYKQGLAILESALGSMHPDVAVALNDMGTGALEAGHAAVARPLYERALAIRRAALGENHVDVARTLSNLANVGLELHDLTLANDYARQSLAVKEIALGPTNPSLGFTLNVLADVELQQGHLDDALAHAQRSLAIRQAALPPTHPYVIETLVMVARVRLVRHELKLLIDLLEPATAAIDQEEDAAMRGSARYLLGRALWETGERTRSPALLRAAQADLVASGDRGTEPRTELVAWLATNSIKL